ncbi:MAG: cytochrome-c peroxidase [Egibacteraceae bacterium]
MRRNRRPPVVPLVTGALLVLAALPAFAVPAPSLGDAARVGDRAIREALSEYASKGTVNGVPLLTREFNANAEVCPLPSEAHSAPEPEASTPTAEEIALIEEGRRLFFSETDFGQKPSLGLNESILGQKLSCADCHEGPAFTNNETLLVGPTEHRQLVPRQTPHLLRQVDNGPFGWDGRFECLQAVMKGAITSPLEMNASRAPTQGELDALAAFVETLDSPDAVPGVDFDPARAARGEKLFNEERGRDPFGRSFPGQRISCATCHAAEGNFSDQDFHVVMFPLFIAPDLEPIDPSHKENGKVVGFNTPVLRGLRFTAPYFHDGLAGDPTGEATPLNAPPDIALLQVVLFYSERFAFHFSLTEQLALVEFLKSL